MAVWYRQRPALTGQRWCKSGASNKLKGMAADTFCRFESLLQKTQQLQVQALAELLGHVEAISSCKGRTEESLESVMRFAERQD